MRYAIAFLAFASAIFAAEPLVTVDLYGNVFLNGENTNQQIGDFARNNPGLAPQVDAAVRDAALAGRKYIADAVKAAQDQAAAQVAAAEAAKADAIAATNALREASVAAKEAELQTAKAARDTWLAYANALEVYLVTIRAQVAGLGGQTSAPPSRPAN